MSEMRGDNRPRVALIGMGEAGTAIVEGWGAGRPPVCAYDIKSDDPATAGAIGARYTALGVTPAANPAEAVATADLVICVVTADQAVAAAEAAAPHLRKGAFWCDLNSCAPSSKGIAAGIVEAAGGRYVDVAVMGPVHPGRNMVPLFVAGPHAADVAPVLESLPMAPRVVEGPVGAASSIKMIRSVMVKGLEALTAECMIAAEAAGVTEAVLASLLKSHGGTDWPRQTAYNLERSLTHGARRAAEMDEVARTLADLGLPNTMASATAGWHRRMAETGIAASEDEPVAAIAGRLVPAVRGTG
ncbi:MAG: NAD(P)-dependent oxidoreductase [Acuticoccus sp.]